MKVRWIHLIFIMGLGYVLTGQPPNFQKIQFTIEDGLPSNECHDVVEDSNGYIWIATNRGLVKYDGYAFHTYGFSEGLGDIVCLKLCKDKYDNIWILTLSKTIYIYEQSTKTIKKYKYDDKLQPYASKTSLADQFYVSKDNTLYINYAGVFTVSIDSNGQLIEHIGDNPYQGFNIISIDDQIIYGSGFLDEHYQLKPYESNVSKGKEGLENQLSFIINGKKIKIPENKKWIGQSLRNAFQLNNNQILMSLYGAHFLINNDSIILYKLGDLINDIKETNSNELYTAQMNRNGVKYFKDLDAFKDNNYSMLLENYSASRLLFDSNENLWVTTLEDGVFYLMKSDIIGVLDSLFSGQKVNQIEVSDNGTLYYIVDDQRLISFNVEQKLISIIKQYNYKLHNLYFDDLIGTLFIGGLITRKLDYFQNGKLHSIENEFKSYGHFTYYHKDIKRIGADILALISYEGYKVLNHHSFLPIDSLYFKLDINGLRLNSIASFENGSLLLGGVKGLFLYKEKKLISLDSLSPEFVYGINDIEKHEKEFIIGTQGGGLLIWNGEEQPIQMVENNGLISNIIDEVTVNDNGQIYVASSSGMSVVEKVDSTYSIRNYNEANGLPSNEVYDIDYYNNTIYVATSKGLCKIESIDTYESPITSPIIEELSVNGIKHNLNLDKTLDHDQNNLRIAYKTLDLPSRGDLEYRYRLNNEAWTITRETSLNYPRMTPGDYAFEVQAKNATGVWSDSTILFFTIKKPFWKSTWFVSLIAGIAMLSFFFWNRERLRTLNRSIRLQEEMNELERKALQAQMNPHFIFNCLHSIQSFIMANDKEAAMNYLSKFAKLIRKNLKASVDKVIPLDEEISTLRSYIELEQIRFNSNFDYEINSKEIKHPSRIMIPPILIQPYVENAILHGMKNKKEGGFISIKFSANNHQLFVEVKDNGGGIRNNKKKTRRSFGTDITQKRLVHINKSKREGYKVDTASNENGTIVNLVIDLYTDHQG